jgi:predicted membrane protein
MSRYSDRRGRGFNPTAHLLLGLMLALLGVLFTLDNLHVLRAREIIQYWPAALIALGIVKIAEGRSTSCWLGGSVWILIGSILLGNRLGMFSLNIWNLWPLMLVLVGVRMVAQAYYRQAPDSPSPDSSSVTSVVAVMGRVDRKIASQTFDHAEITVVLGGAKLDLRDATLAGGQAVINVVGLMGGFELLVPDSWSVVFEVTPFMGGIEDKRRVSPPSPSAPRLILRGFVMMSGVEIKD